jgi:hypothetical protein
VTGYRKDPRNKINDAAVITENMGNSNEKAAQLYENCSY